MTTGEKITEERKKLSYTQVQLAEELGVTRQAVSRWESDVAFPETDTLIKMSKLFGCSIDYLLDYNQTNEEKPQGGADEKAENPSGNNLYSALFGSGLKTYFEYKSKTTLFGVPLVHINIGLGRVAKGIISVGLCSVGVISFGLLSLGILSLGLLSLGLLALGSISAGVLALGGVAFGLVIAFGGVAIGTFSFGGCSIGAFAFGGYASGSYIAVGGYATGGIAFGEKGAYGSVLSVIPETYEELKPVIDEKFAEIPSFWCGFTNIMRGLADMSMRVLK